MKCIPCMRAMTALSFFLASFTCFGADAATTWYIKPDGTGDAPTIQAGINATASGDIVLVAAGVFSENISFMGKRIEVVSESGALATTINGSGTGSVVSFPGGEGRSSVLRGFTITNGNAAFGGGGIYCESSPSILRCIITGNVATELGGGVYLGSAAEPLVADCTISNNTAKYGGGIEIFGNSTSPIVTNCTISSNVTTTGDGGGINTMDNSWPIITDCVIQGNTAAGSGGGMALLAGLPFVANCLVTGNRALHDGGGIYSYGTLTVVNSTIAGNRASFNGGGVYQSRFELIFEATIIWGNCAPTGNEYYLSGGASNAAFGCCDVNLAGVVLSPPATITWREDTIFSNPLFCDPIDCNAAPSGDGDYRLAALSDALDAAGCGLIGARGEGCNAPTGVFDSPSATEPARLTAFPNPSNPSVTISYHVPRAGRVRLAVYDVEGRLVRSLVDGTVPSGTRSLTWNHQNTDGQTVASGVYFLRLEATGGVQTSKLVLLK